MNILDQMGVQRWRLKSSFRDKTDDVLATEDRADEITIDDASANSNAANLSENAAAIPAEAIDAKQEVSRDLNLLSWRELEETLSDATRCASCANSDATLGEGDANADWLFVIDAPSAQDSQAQQLLSGRNGQLFAAILRSINLKREQIYLSSVFKCPPPAELNLSPQCGGIIYRQLALIKPKVVVALGEFTAQTLLRANQNLAILRQENVHDLADGARLIATHSIADMLENPQLKAEFWHDLKQCLT